MDGHLIQLSDLIVKRIPDHISNIYVGSLIIWYKPNYDDIFSVASPSVVVMSFTPVTWFYVKIVEEYH